MSIEKYNQKTIVFFNLNFLGRKAGVIVVSIRNNLFFQTIKEGMQKIREDVRKEWQEMRKSWTEQPLADKIGCIIALVFGIAMCWGIWNLDWPNLHSDGSECLLNKKW